MMAIIWQFKTFPELSTKELYDVLALRETVFVLEQQCLFQDIDHQDQAALHLLGYDENKLLVYLRFFAPQPETDQPACFGRVAVSFGARGRGLAKLAVQKILTIVDQDHPNEPIVISAQCYLETFYASFGFQAVGEPFDEDGIMHISMRR